MKTNHLLSAIILGIFLSFLGFLNVPPTYAQQCTPISNEELNMGAITYFLDIPQSGNYTLFVRMKAFDSQRNSVYVQIDNTCPVVFGDSSSIPSNSWQYVDFRNGNPNNKMSFNLSQGRHSVTLIGREPGVRVDRILFKPANVSCNPTGKDDLCVQSTTPTVSSPLPTTTPHAPTQIPTVSHSPTNPMQTPTRTPSPTPPQTGSGTNSIEIYAAGYPYFDEYPTMKLYINQREVREWSNINGNFRRKPYPVYTYTTNENLDNATIRIALTNDKSNASKTEDINLFIDKIVVNGQTFETESPDVYSTSCNPQGYYPQQEALYCDGYVEYPKINASGSRIVVYAAGYPAQRVYPQMRLLVNDRPVQTWSAISHDPKRKPYQAYTYNSPTKVNREDIKVEFINDLKVGREDRNLYIDKIMIDGVTFETEARTTYTDSCDQGYKRREALWCNGYFQY